MKSLVGSWELVSTYRLRADGTRVYYLGDKPRGRLTYTAEGYMHAIMAASERPRPRGPALDEREKAGMFDTLVAYSGSYRIEQNQVIHHVDAAWNEGWLGQDKARFFELKGDQLSILTAPTPDPTDGSMVVYVVEWKLSSGMRTDPSAA